MDKILERIQTYIIKYEQTQIAAEEKIQQLVAKADYEGIAYYIYNVAAETPQA